MIREFSKELPEERQFELGGELFEFRYPHWEEAAELFDSELEPAKNGDGKEEPGTFSFKEDTQLAISKFPMFLDPKNDSHKRFKALVARKTDPVPRHQIVQAYRWLVQVTSGLPTSPPSASEAGGGSEDTSSQDGSS